MGCSLGDRCTAWYEGVGRREARWLLGRDAVAGVPVALVAGLAGLVELAAGTDQGLDVLLVDGGPGFARGRLQRQCEGRERLRIGVDAALDVVGLEGGVH